jgi:hypothetical protein
MATTGPDGSSPFSLTPLVPANDGLPVTSSVVPEHSPFDPALIQQTKNEIRTLVQEITHLSRASLPVPQYYEEFLRRVVSALAAHGGAVWTARDNGPLHLEYQINLPPEFAADQEPIAARHRLLLHNVITTGQATLVPPRSGSSCDEEAGNPTELLLVLAALRLDQRPCGVVEVFQRAGGGPTTQRGYLRFLVQMCDLASEFLRNSRLRQLDDRQNLWLDLERFLQQVHAHLDSRAVAYTVANEGRRLIGCERASVTVARGRRHEVVAVSGLDAIDRRAADVRLLGNLASVVCAAGRPFWFDGHRQDCAPQIEKHLDAYLDRAHATVLGIVPLTAPSADHADPPSPADQAPPIGALIVEQLSSHRVEPSHRERTETVALHSASALAHALEYESLFLMPVWRTLGKAKWILRARTLPKVLLALAAVAGLLLAMLIIPADFDLAANGKLQPAQRRDVFAFTDGVVVEVPVRHEQIVEQGQLLARLQNTEVEMQIADLTGRKRTTQERILSLQRAQLDGRLLRTEEQNRLSGELLELREVEEGLDRELELLREKEQQLVVRSSMRGQVVTWNVSTLLLRRPVQRGQLLMTLLDLDGDWELELYMPERRMGHVGRATAHAGNALPVTFLLASHPETPFAGQIAEIHRMAEVHGDEGNCVVMRVAIDRKALPELRSETSVTARVHCGRRPLGFVLFHELLETLQRRVWFWL